MQGIHIIYVNIALYIFVVYTFDKAQCINCPHRDECMKGKKTKARKLTVSVNAPIYYEMSQKQKEKAFLDKYKKRSSQEWKNGEMKRFHGLSRARGWGLRSILFQAKLTAIAVNLKRIATIVREKTSKAIAFWSFFRYLENTKSIFPKFSMRRDRLTA